MENEFSKKTTIESDIKRNCVFPTDVFDFYIEANLKELEVLPGFSIGGHSHKEIWYRGDSVCSRYRKELTGISTEDIKGKSDKRTTNKL